MRPVQRRSAVRAVRNQLEAGERPACRWLGVNRTLFDRRLRRRDDESLRLRLIALAIDYHRYGLSRFTVLLRREGFADNPKRTIASPSAGAFRFRNASSANSRWAGVPMRRL